jgi:hypothetical protein
MALHFPFAILHSHNDLGYINFHPFIPSHIIGKKQTDRQTNRQTDRQIPLLIIRLHVSHLTT